MTKPKRSCDLIMKGGITSGVVYPRAVIELSKHYCFRNIGGTSAGAIAAVVTAAAEYGRDSGGFDKVAALPDELSCTLMEKFQQPPHLRPLFGLLLAGLSGSWVAIVRALLSGYRTALAIGVAPGTAILLLPGLSGHSWSFGLLGLLIAVVGGLRRPDSGCCTPGRA